MQGGLGAPGRIPSPDKMINTYLSLFYREQHLEKKIEQLTAEARTKFAKEDKKGKFCRNSIIYYATDAVVGGDVSS